MHQDDHAWFAVQVRPRHELTTAKILRNKGVEEFVPLYNSRRQWSDRQKDIQLPLFTGYIFCKFASRAKLPVVTTPGVIRIVGSRKGPIPIADHEIASIQIAVQEPVNVSPHPYLAIGSKVKVEEGPFTGLQGILVNHKNGSQLVVSLDIVQRSMAIEIDRSAVKIVDDPIDLNIQARVNKNLKQISGTGYSPVT